MDKLLTVCIGNICRSPLAQVLLQRELPQHTVWSAGLSALVGSPADPTSVQIASEHQLDLGPHRAQQISAWLCQQVDLILVMELTHKAQLEKTFPQVRGKVFRIGHHGQFDVADPYRRPREAFDQSWAAISQGVADWAPRIRQLSSR